MLLSPAILRANPWWKDRTAIERDPLIRVAASAPAGTLPALPFRFDRDAIYMVRGPRQVGKTTLLKRVVQSVLRNPETAAQGVLYFDYSSPYVAAAPRFCGLVRIYTEWARAQHVTGRLIVLIDEISGIKRWRGIFDDWTNVTMIVTCANATDTATGGAPWYGPVDDPRDWSLMPLGFRGVLAAHDPDLAAMLPPIDASDPRATHTAALEIIPHRRAIRAWLRRYLLAGGYPRPFAELLRTGRIDASTLERHRGGVGRQLTYAGRREPAMRAIVSWAADRRLGREFSWSSLAANTDVGTKRTAQRCVEDGVGLFLWHVASRARDAGTLALAPRAVRRLYATDPFAWHALASWAANDADAWDATVARVADPTSSLQLAESVAADHVIRGHRGAVVYHLSPKRGESIDLVGHRPEGATRIAFHWGSRVTRLDVTKLARYGGGLIATRDELDFDPTANVVQLPLYALLAGDADPISFYPTPRAP